MTEKSSNENVKLRYENIIKSYTFEYEVFKRINATLSEGETIRHGDSIKPNFRLDTASISLRLYRPDIYLQEGCKELDIEGTTYIEVKNRLVLGAISRYRRLFDEIKDKCDTPIKNFIIVYQESSINEGYLKKESGNGFQIVSFSELEERGLKNLEKEAAENEDDQKNLLKKTRTTFENGDVVLFLGAGVSMSAGLPSWNNLLKRILKKGTTVPESDFDFISTQCFESSIITARYIKYLYKNKMEYSLGKEVDDGELNHEFKELLVDELYPSELNVEDDKDGQFALIKSICDMICTGKVESVITYNYDDLVEQELESRHIQYTSINGKNRWMKGDVPIYHVHGMLPSNKKNILDSEIILSEKEYHKAYKESYNWSTVEQLHALRYKSCFFIGLSMSDPNLRRLLDLASDGTDKEKHHFVFLQNTTGLPFHTSKNAEIIQSMMNGFGLNVIWYKEHEDLPGILKQICAE